MRRRPLGRTGLDVSALAFNARGLYAAACADLDLDEAAAALALARVLTGIDLRAERERRRGPAPAPTWEPGAQPAGAPARSN